MGERIKIHPDGHYDPNALPGEPGYDFISHALARYRVLRYDIVHYVASLSSLDELSEWELNQIEFICNMVEQDLVIECRSYLPKKPGFSGGTPTEIITRYRAGELTKEQLIEELVHYPYAKFDDSDYFNEDYTDTAQEVTRNWGPYPSKLNDEIYHEITRREDLNEQAELAAERTGSSK